MNVVFRTDASRQIGTGHVMRSLTLAEHLKKQGASVTFICSCLRGHLIDLIKGYGFQCQSITPSYDLFEDANQTKRLIEKELVDWLIVDHYSLDSKWEKVLRPYTERIMVIDDLADREHDCDLLLDYQIGSNHHLHYESLVPKDAVKLLGLKFLLLRPEFIEARKSVKIRQSVNRLLVSFGGSDKTGESVKVLRALEQLSHAVTVDVVIGQDHPFKHWIEEWCAKRSNITCHVSIDYISQLMAKADLAIGAGGTTTYERAYLGLPALVIETANNQTGVIQSAEKLGFVQSLGTSETVTTSQITTMIDQLISLPENVHHMSRNAFELFSSVIDLNEITRWMNGGEAGGSH
ncbi:UDP-2,4-diacetamido-2,4,6-trideoxy-beta-L-altropyranose hydrolase [Alkalibacillus silvisoli]|uniref:UDP-2,4-diacetamido-2,4, 6-trideoxy-beta-L-altropyranose hydrolase n=1 Tax=Alkalibacillus silvisoli TaxID=392823 RepID=A0ABN0ZNR0_9BACI